jgi:hypothetical protein
MLCSACRRLGVISGSVGSSRGSREEESSARFITADVPRCPPPAIGRQDEQRVTDSRGQPSETWVLKMLSYRDRAPGA